MCARCSRCASRNRAICATASATVFAARPLGWRFVRASFCTFVFAGGKSFLLCLSDAIGTWPTIRAILYDRVARFSPVPWGNREFILFLPPCEHPTTATAIFADRRRLMLAFYRAPPGTPPSGGLFHPLFKTAAHAFVKVSMR